MNILLVEDDTAQADSVEREIRQSGHRISKVERGKDAISFLQANEVDLVVLDWELPGVSGFEVLYWIRRHLGREPAVLFVTSRLLEVDIVQALDAGADDYVVKPFRTEELVARVGALLRRTRRSAKVESAIAVGPYSFDVTRRAAYLHGESILLTEKEFVVAAHFFSNVGRVVSKRLLAKLVWGRELDSTSRTIDTHIYRLRRKLALCPDNGVRLTTVYTHGYRLDEVDAGSVDLQASVDSEPEVPVAQNDTPELGAQSNRR
ncbi:response regulator transcription factor [Paraburkholderia sprentiae WSM5005]|uniref:Response regulator transcription factor n=1 Tax=Paraburkholderia sprentiae WSM5005 TaxID=754502 RepID=A0A1I9YRC5_9BURK|nr:response regulator transcription factor [Paraburkholderia sprentiae]APA88759.1 response regulator transcription factor [Paraburkholderia sprentiae WSM5005]